MSKGYYPKRVLTDQIYRTRANRNYCKKHGIRLSNPKPGHLSVNVKKWIRNSCLHYTGINAHVK